MDCTGGFDNGCMWQGTKDDTVIVDTKKTGNETRTLMVQNRMICYAEETDTDGCCTSINVPTKEIRDKLIEALKAIEY